MVPSPVLRRRLADDLGEARAERSERGGADGDARVGDRHPLSQQRLRPLDATGHQVGVRRLAVGRSGTCVRSAPATSTRSAPSPARRAAGRTHGRSGHGPDAGGRGRRAPPRSRGRRYPRPAAPVEHADRSSGLRSAAGRHEGGAREEEPTPVAGLSGGRDRAAPPPSERGLLRRRALCRLPTRSPALFAGLPGTLAFRIVAPATARTRRLDISSDPARQLFVASSVKVFIAVEALRQEDSPDVSATPRRCSWPRTPTPTPLSCDPPARLPATR